MNCVPGQRTEKWNQNSALATDVYICSEHSSITVTCVKYNDAHNDCESM